MPISYAIVESCAGRSCAGRSVDGNCSRSPRAIAWESPLESALDDQFGEAGLVALASASQLVSAGLGSCFGPALGLALWLECVEVASVSRESGIADRYPPSEPPNDARYPPPPPLPRLSWGLPLVLVALRAWLL